MNDQVFRNAIIQRIESQDYLAFASGKEEGRYLDFSFGRGSIPALDKSSLLIDHEAAKAYLECMGQAVQPAGRAK